MLAIQDVKDYLGIDFDDDATIRILNKLISVADLYCINALGVNYPKDNEQVHLVQLLLISDLFDKREFDSGRVTNTIKKFISDTLNQIRIGMLESDENAVQTSDNNSET